MAATRAGCDAIGLIFYAPSPRFVSIEQARKIVACLPPFVAAVGLFVDAGEHEIRSVLSEVHLDILQFHGDETAQDCNKYEMPFIKAVRVRESTNLLQYASDYADAHALLLDTYKEGTAGGTGEVFDWKMIPEGLSKPIILAGGLTPANVTQAINQVRPYAVDVSGGVEKSKGIKDADKIAAFMQGVEDAAL